jgi:hypothetical protein
MLLTYLRRLTAAFLVGLFLQLMVGVGPASAAPNPLKNAYFGDTHVHASWSPDAFSSGTRTTPRDAYACAKGTAIDHAAGYKIQLKQPLDFYMVTDHSEYMGILPKAQEPENEVLYNTEVAKLLRSDNPENRTKGLLTIVGSIAGSSPKIPEFVSPEISHSVWQEIVQIADENYEPGKFTTFPAYE